MEQLLQAVRERIGSFDRPVTTEAERKEVASVAYKIARTKTAIDTVGKDLVASAKAEIKKVDAARKQARDTLDGWKEQVRAPLTAWEQQREKAAEAIGRITEAGNNPGTTTEEIKAIMERLGKCDVAAFCEDYQEAAKAALEQATEKAAVALEHAEEREKEQAELEALRKEKAEREAKEAQDRREAEIAERAKAQVLAAEAEKARKAEAEAERRKADKARRDRVESEVLADLLDNASLSDIQAALVWRAIAEESIRHIRVKW